MSKPLLIYLSQVCLKYLWLVLISVALKLTEQQQHISLFTVVKKMARNKPSTFKVTGQNKL